MRLRPLRRHPPRRRGPGLGRRVGWAARFRPDGTLIGKLLLPEAVSNLTFGGIKRNHLFITASTSPYALRVTFNGVRDPA
ncbi:hypothetical protein GCM10022267_67360 [Lentzea roselyniae]|uniref:SMP-30/Gluconolaconase/LRE-like region-containing protein n=1 Tax=Lentzea roselyniae TaxID=531940 RepID=A0ABP7BXW9_9PSEU